MRHVADYQWWTSQIDGRWADHLRSDLVDPAWVALYLSTLESYGPISKLAEPTADPAGLAVRRLADAGLITITASRRGQWTYRTLHRLKNVGRSSTWNQPPPGRCSEPPWTEDGPECQVDGRQLVQLTS